MKHLLVTNDFPPKVGGIQSYLWELWRRLPATEAAVLTTPYDGAAAFDEAAPIPIERIDARVMLPTGALLRRIEAAADRAGMHGKAVTPFLLSYIVGASEGRSLEVNLDLARNNVRLAAEIATAWSALKNNG